MAPLQGTVIAQYPYQIDYAYSDNGKEFKGTDDHAFVKACRQHGIGQKLLASIALNTTVKLSKSFAL